MCKPCLSQCLRLLRWSSLAGLKMKDGHQSAAMAEEPVLPTLFHKGTNSNVGLVFGQNSVAHTTMNAGSIPVLMVPCLSRKMLAAILCILYAPFFCCTGRAAVNPVALIGDRAVRHLEKRHEQQFAEPCRLSSDPTPRELKFMLRLCLVR